jgi:hypothetical protein
MPGAFAIGGCSALRVCTSAVIWSPQCHSSQWLDHEPFVGRRDLQPLLGIVDVAGVENVLPFGSIPSTIDGMP